jgi:hypothetical protein
VDIEARDQFSLDEHAPAHVKSTTPVTDGERENSPSPVRFIVQVTIEKSTHDKLRPAQALLSHSLSSRDVAKVLDRALDALIEKLETRKFGSAAGGRRPRASAAQSIHSPRKFGSSSRYIAAHTRRTVWERDRGRCTFVSTSGHRCGERRLLQFDHVEPVARGGKPSVEGLRLRCRAHNLLEAERAFGREFMKRKREHARCDTTAAGARAHATETRTLSAPPGTAADDLTQDVLAGLRGLGCRGEEARRAALFSLSIESGTLEERMRAALGFISRRSIRACRAATT